MSLSLTITITDIYAGGIRRLMQNSSRGRRRETLLLPWEPSPHLRVIVQSLSADYIRDATLCMLCRQDGNNVPAMSQYLSHYFCRHTGAISHASHRRYIHSSSEGGCDSRRYAASWRQREDLLGSPVACTLDTWPLGRWKEMFLVFKWKRVSWPCVRVLNTGYTFGVSEWVVS